MAKPGPIRMTENYLYNLEIDIDADHPDKDWILEHAWITMMDIKRTMKDKDTKEHYVKAKVY